MCRCQMDTTNAKPQNVRKLTFWVTILSLVGKLEGGSMCFQNCLPQKDGDVPVFSFITFSAEAAAPTAGEIENCTQNRTLFAAKWKGNWLNFECILTVSKSHFLAIYRRPGVQCPGFRGKNSSKDARLSLQGIQFQAHNNDWKDFE